ncbi:CDP-alcohol phosphatidyltransferase family protein [Actinoplanes sp. URMC 104]|uniref:CDP-alcohol phosphatidyltransferase family protein n=1 Tax=Actinoplanes sp. URMC 104 TaxID=3423409 RepID=UPI003F1BBFF8
MNPRPAPVGDSSRAPVVGLAAQLALLALLGSTLGLTTAGLLTGAAYGLVLCGLLGAGLSRAGMGRLGPANAVTLARALLVGGVIAMVVTSFVQPVSIPVLATIAGVALAMDGVDGQVARRTGTTTALGARFDMEIDSVLVLVLGAYVGHEFGWWWLALGLYRYAFAVATWVFPWLNAALPFRFSRKVVAALQGVVLAAVMAGVLPTATAQAALAVALAAVTWSFGLDTLWLYRAQRVRVAARQRWSDLPQPALVS